MTPSLPQPVVCPPKPWPPLAPRHGPRCRDHGYTDLQCVQSWRGGGVSCNLIPGTTSISSKYSTCRPVLAAVSWISARLGLALFSVLNRHIEPGQRLSFSAKAHSTYSYEYSSAVQPNERTPSVGSTLTDPPASQITGSANRPGVHWSRPRLSMRCCQPTRSAPH